MKKMNNKGFMLIETLVVASFVVATLVFLYAQFRTINRSYDTTFKYNNVVDLYALGEIDKYIKEDGYDKLTSVLQNSETDFIDFQGCSSVFFAESEYCLSLMEDLKAEYVMLTKENLASLKNYFATDTELPEEFKAFVNTISYDRSGTRYRLIAQFENGTYATLVI